MKIGIIGLGYVGTAVKTAFETTNEVLTYDVNKPCTEVSAQAIAVKADVIFVCVPTPMNVDGSCNIDTVRNVLGQLSMVHTEHRPICILKSTIPPGTSDTLAAAFPGLSIVFNPEFLTEANYINDFLSQEDTIVGLTIPDDTVFATIEQLYKHRFYIDVIKTTAKEAELIKYVANTLLATKVAYLNEIWQLCNKLGINYDTVCNISAEDARLGTSHWKVPGPDGHFGFGGTCFIKDLNALIKCGEQTGLSMSLLKAVWNKNLEVRPEKDWELDKGRAVI